jgi:fluoride ion exporter CrcB/FEX
MLGSFLMGLFQDGIVLGLSLPLPIAWLSPQHPFQRMSVFHTAFKTGFCGSLTTFSSWNSAMVVLIYGTGSNGSSQLWLALLGYIIGMETALGSFVCGKSVARLLHRKVNPMLALEAHAVRDRKEEGVYIYWELPDFERRFLTLIDVADEQAHNNLDLSVEHLEAWRRSTVDARRVRHPLLPALCALEEAALITREPLPKDAETLARDQGWDVDALLQWAAESERHPSSSSTFALAQPPNANEVSRWFTLPVAAFFFWFLIFAIFVAFVMFNEDEDPTVIYRTMSFAMLFAPFGSFAQWWLADYNGKLSKYPWFPYGTFGANMLGSIISITAIATEYYIDQHNYGRFNFWRVGSIRAIRIGFAGCLTTVSTFVAEIHGFMQEHTDYAYPYIFTSLSVACVLSTIIYGIIAYAI